MNHVQASGLSLILCRQRIGVHIDNIGISCNARQCCTAGQVIAGAQDAGIVAAHTTATCTADNIITFGFFVLDDRCQRAPQNAAKPLNSSTAISKPHWNSIPSAAAPPVIGSGAPITIRSVVYATADWFIPAKSAIKPAPAAPAIFRKPRPDVFCLCQACLFPCYLGFSSLGLWIVRCNFIDNSLLVWQELLAPIILNEVKKRIRNPCVMARHAFQHRQVAIGHVSD